MEGVITQVDPGSICWFPLGQTIQYSLPGGFWHEYGSEPGVIVFWKNTLFFPLESLLLITQDKYELYSTNPFILPILKPIQKILLPNTDWTHPRVSFLSHLILPTLDFYSIYPTLAVAIEPTLILIFTRLSSFSSFIFLPKGEFILLGVELGEMFLE